MTRTPGSFRGRAAVAWGEALRRSEQTFTAFRGVPL
jgi:hypothetical protein